VSYARKSRDLLRSDTSHPTDTTLALNSTTNPSNSSDSDLLGDYSHILPPREPATPARGWKPPVGSPSSWVTEREMATLPEWDFRASLGHRRTSSSFTTRTLAALGLDKRSKGSEKTETTGTFHTAPTHKRASVSSAASRRYSAPEHSQRPDGSVVGVLEPSPFDPLPPHNFSSITKLSVPRSAGASDGVTSSVADLGGARTLALIDHGAHVAVHDFSSSSQPGMRSSRSVNVLPTIPGTPAPPSPNTSWWPSEMGETDEWVPVDAPPVSESWRRADSVCGALGVLGLVLCFVSFKHSTADSRDSPPRSSRSACTLPR
jgi:hypothetical protein